MHNHFFISRFLIMVDMHFILKNNHALILFLCLLRFLSQWLEIGLLSCIYFCFRKAAYQLLLLILPLMRLCNSEVFMF